MPANYFFLAEPFSTGSNKTLDESESLHLTRVMRKKEGEQIKLVNGKSELALGTIQILSKKEVIVSIESVETIRPALPQLILVQALPKPSHLELILQKGTELGIAEFWFFPGDFSEKKEISANQQRRYDQILIAALKQCGRFDLPKLKLKPALKDLCFLKEAAFFGDLRKSAPLFKEIKIPDTYPLFFVVGPEKGFSNREIMHLDSQATGVNLHPYTLRAETAALSAMALLSHFLL